MNALGTLLRTATLSAAQGLSSPFHPTTAASATSAAPAGGPTASASSAVGPAATSAPPLPAHGVGESGSHGFRVCSFCLERTEGDLQERFTAVSASARRML